MLILSIHLEIYCCEHIHQAFNTFSYLKRHLNSKLVINTEGFYFEERFKSHFKGDVECFEFRGKVKEEIPVDDIIP